MNVLAQIRLTVLAGIGLAATACSAVGASRQVGTTHNAERLVDYRLRVECACDWTASLPDGLVESGGRATLQLPDDPFVCAGVSKTEDDDRLLRARVLPDGEWAETDVGHETITVCARGNAPLPLPDPER